MLVLVWATKYFSRYLFGRRFVVRTDHSAVSYVRNFAHHKSRLMMWSLRLSELSLLSSIGQVDALNRYVGAEMLDNSLSKENVVYRRRPMTNTKFLYP